MKMIRNLNKVEYAYPAAMALGNAWVLTDNFYVYLICSTLAVFLIVNSSFAVVQTTAITKGTFDPIPLPIEVRKKITVRHEHRHEHHNYNFSQCEEGREVSQKLPDGREIKVRHVRRWQ